MKSIFVVSGSNSEYSSRNDWDVVATENEQTAITLVEQLNELVALKIKFNDGRCEFMIEYKKANPQPLHARYLKPSDEFKRCESVFASVEDRAKFRILSVEHMQAKELARKTYTAWWADFASAEAVWVRENDIVPAHLKKAHDLNGEMVTYDASYHYHQLDVIE